MKNTLQRLASKHGTPLYVYNSKRILQKLSSLQNAFTQQLHVHYAMKANNFSPLLKLLAKKRIGVDVVSGGEISHALNCGFNPNKIIFSGVAKTEEEILYALKLGIFSINVESPQELERIGRMAKKIKKIAAISFRLNPDVNPKTHPYITTGFKENKFGMDKSFLPELISILNQYPKHLLLHGLDFHIGSQLTSTSPFDEALIKSIPIFKNLRSRGYPLKYFDVGGGIGISYKGEKVINLKQYARKIEKHISSLGCQIHCEPGRYLVADAGYLLTKVEYIKKTPFKNFVIVNTGMHHLIRPSLYGAHHKIEPLNPTRKKITVDVVGPICESSDFLAKDRLMAEPKQNDILVVYDVGAYGATMASDYNMQPRAKEILI